MPLKPVYVNEHSLDWLPCIVKQFGLRRGAKLRDVEENTCEGVGFQGITKRMNEFKTVCVCRLFYLESESLFFRNLRPI